MVRNEGLTGSSILLYNAVFHTMNEANPLADTVLIEGEKISEVGMWSEMSHCSAETKLDLEGLAVVPGLIDSHVHLLSYGLSLGELDLSDARSVDEVLELLSSAQVEEGVLRASQLDPDSLKEERYPTRSELDRVHPTRPVFLKRRDEHSSVVNTAAFRMLEFPDGTEGVVVDPSTGDTTGILRKKANQIALESFHGMIEEEEMKESYATACTRSAEKGATTVHSLIGADEKPERKDCETLLEIQDELPIRTVIYYQTRHVERALGLGLDRVGGCILLDGAIGSRTAAFSDEYADDRGNRGSLYLDDDDLYLFFDSAERSGLQIAVHAIGDRAVEQALRCFEKVAGELGATDRRHRIEHAELVFDEQLDRMAALGICLGMQPAFEGFWGEAGGMYERRLGRERARNLNRLAAAEARGVCVSGGSDAPITPVDPLYGIHCAVNHPAEASRLSVKQALELFTTAGARIGHIEDRLGSIRPGLSADLVVLSRDPFSVPPGSIAEIEVLLVFCRGKMIVDRLSAGRTEQGVKNA